MHRGTDAPLFPEIYRQKLQQCAADGVLSDEDVKALTRLRVMLCIPQHTIDAAHSDICGSLFEKVKSFFQYESFPQVCLIGLCSIPPLLELVCFNLFPSQYLWQFSLI